MQKIRIKKIIDHPNSDFFDIIIDNNKRNVVKKYSFGIGDNAILYDKEDNINPKLIKGVLSHNLILPVFIKKNE